MVGGPVSRALRTANPTLARQLTLEGRIEISLSLSLSLVERDNIARHWSAQRVAQPAAVSTLRESQYPSIRFRNIRMVIVEASKIRSNFSHRRICVFRLFVPPPFNSPCRGSKPIPPSPFHLPIRVLLCIPTVFFISPPLTFFPSRLAPNLDLVICN